MASAQPTCDQIRISSIIIRLLRTGAAPVFTRPEPDGTIWKRDAAPQDPKPTPLSVGTMDLTSRAPYFFLALIVSHAFATQASNRGSL